VAGVVTDDTRTLSVKYQSVTQYELFGSYIGNPTSKSVTVLTGNLPQRIVCAQPGVEDQWNMPFFFGDNRGMFYVTPWQGWVGIDRCTGFGLNPAAYTSVTNLATGGIPSLVVPLGPPQPDPGLQVAATGIDATIAGAAVNSGALRAVIGGGTNIAFQGRSVGVNSSVAVAPAPSAEVNQVGPADANQLELQGGE
jgi:hypothetical protein